MESLFMGNDCEFAEYFTETYRGLDSAVILVGGNR